jgi:hypothetical protein
MHTASRETSRRCLGSWLKARGAKPGFMVDGRVGKVKFQKVKKVSES